jgi:hypothetical protein
MGMVELFVFLLFLSQWILELYPGESSSRLKPASTMVDV